jgi:hypothetical protein
MKFSQCKAVKLFGLILLEIIFVVCLLNNVLARQVILMPGISKIRVFSYKNLLYKPDYIVVKGKTFRLLTKKNIRFAETTLLYYTGLITMNNTEKLISDVEHIKNMHDALYNMADPIEALAYLIKKYLIKEDDLSVKILSKAISESLISAASLMIQGKSKSADKAFKLALEGLGAENKVAAHAIIEVIKNHPILKYLLTKTIDIAVDMGITKLKGEAFNIAIEGIMSGGMTLLEGINNFINVIDTSWAISETVDTEKRIYIQSLVLDFIKDYVLKYKMNIEQMTKDTTISFYRKFSYLKGYTFSINNNGGKYYDLGHPRNFYQLFLWYLINKGKIPISDVKTEIYYGSSINNDEYYYLLAAREALDIIEHYGDGGNFKVILDIDDITGKVKPRFKILRLYWMPSKDIIDNVRILEEIPNEKASGIVTPNMVRLGYFEYYDPFVPYSKYDYGNIVIPRYPDSLIKDHVSFYFDHKEIITKNGINYLLLYNAGITINYNGFNPRYKVYKKQSIRFGNIAIPLYGDTEAFVNAIKNPELKKAIVSALNVRLLPGRTLYTSDNWHWWYIKPRDVWDYKQAVYMPDVITNWFREYVTNPELPKFLEYFYDYGLLDQGTIKRILENYKNEWILTRGDIANILVTILSKKIKGINAAMSLLNSKYIAEKVKSLLNLDSSWNTQGLLLATMHIMKGEPLQNGKYGMRPDRPITKREFLILLYRTKNVLQRLQEDKK